MDRSFIITGKIIAAIIRNTTSTIEELIAAASKECPNCKYDIFNNDASSQWLGLPCGVKFDPTDHELLAHLEGKVGRAAPHVLVDEFIPTIEEVEGICYTHPEKLPGIKRDGSSVHFFHRISNAYDVGGRKRRKISNKNSIDSYEHMAWHKTGRSSPIYDNNGVIKGWKKILVLNKSEKGKRKSTNWTIHQCHLGVEEDEKHGDLVVSKVFWQVGSNNIRKSPMCVADVESDAFAVKIDPTTPNTFPLQPRRVSGSPFETEQNQDEEEPGASDVQLNAEPLDFAWLPDLDEHPLLNYDINERPVLLQNLDYPSPDMDALPRFSDLGYSTSTLTDILNDCLNGNVAQHRDGF